MLPFWLLIVTILIVFGYCLYATVGPNPPIIVSKATTHLTTPLGKDGLPDYAAVLLADTMKGVTPETNAAVPLLEAMDIKEFDKLEPSEKDNLELVFDTIGAVWPPDESREVPSLYAEELRIAATRLYRERVPRPTGIPPAPQAMETMDEPLSDEDEEVYELPEAATDSVFWNLSDKEAAKDDRASYYEERMHDRPWSQSDVPFLAAWFDRNSAAIDHVAAGLDRPQWALPKSGWIRGESDPTNWLDMTALMGSRQVARTLLARTLYKIGEQDWQAARRDGLAIMKLTAHFAEGPFLVDQLVAIAIDGLAASAIRQMALSPESPVDELRMLLKEFDAIGPASRMRDTMDSGERYYGLSEVIAWSNSSDMEGRLAEYLDFVGLMGSSPPSPLVLQMVGRFSIDWNIALRRLNETYDRVLVAAKIPNGRDRRAALALIDTDNESASSRIQDAMSGVGRVWTSAARGDIAADLFASISMMSFESLFAGEDRNRIDRALTRTAIALAIHRAEHDEYPESLDDLVPHVLPKAIVDPVYGGPLAYRRIDDGFLVYSLGFNGVDDGGSNDGESLGYGITLFEGIRTDQIDDETEAANLTAKIPKGADDLSLRAPLPIKPWPWERATGEGSDDAASDPLMAD
ncbi:hypothetical protein K2D_42670 [Planctomycetes bacterium K2D]|nr:hypothetical protein K2D_42670 [Planctomycetes bacterium K2D]